jgi:hypothetical protein
MSALATWHAAVAEASRAFDSRWTMRALRRVDAALAAKFETALADWHETCLTGDDADIKEIGAGIVRGYSVIVAKMEAAAAEHDAYLRGVCLRTGTVVIISDNKACEDIGAIHLTPDEVASLVGGLETLKQAKAVFPGCEVIDCYPTEGAKS